MRADFCVEALEEALKRYGRPEIFNTDKGTASSAVAASPAFYGRMRSKSAWADAVAG
jgi:putative transposase